MSPIEKTTPCDCPAPEPNGIFYCPRHKCEKHQRLWELCAADIRHFQMGEEGRMPQQKQRPVTACRHRGVQTHTVPCGGCNGAKVDTPVHNCNLFGDSCALSIVPQTRFCYDCQFAAADTQVDITISDGKSPGDIVVLAAALKALHETHPGKYITRVKTPCPAVFENSPYVVAGESENIVHAGYSADEMYATINQSNQRPIHFVSAYCASLAADLGLPEFGPKNWLEPAITLSNLEKSWFPQVAGDFWIVNAGIKSDYTAKLWGGYAETVARTAEKIRWVQIGSREHNHPWIPGTIDLRGRTDLRQLIRLVYHARGVLCGVTALGHLAHWVERPPGRALRPAVIICGGRESPHWFAYPGQQVFHTIGELPCCATGGCWKSRVRPLETDPEHNQSLCERPRGDVGECMERISPAAVADTILRLVKAS